MIHENAPPTSGDPRQAPEEMRELEQWVGWRRERRAGKLTKPPYRVDGEGKAASDNRATWSPFEEALEAFEAGRCHGVGFMFSSEDPFYGLDLDKCRDPATGELEPWALEIVDSFDGAYIEASPSGAGVHIIAKGTGPGRRRGRLEAYGARRFFTVTGDVIRGGPSMVIANQQPQIDALISKYLTDPEPEPNGHQAGPDPRGELGDEELLELARKARNGEKFSRLYEAGDIAGYGGDDSRADLALASMLAFFTRDPGQLERLMNSSALGRREKWRIRPDYRRRTVERALAGGGVTYAGKRRKRVKHTSEEDANGNGTGGGRSYERSDLGNAERFVDMHGDAVRWCQARKSWLVFDGKRWVWDERGAVVRLAHLTARSIHKDAALAPDIETQRAIAKFAVASQNEGRINGMLSQAKPYLAVVMAELDSDPWVFNCQNGTLNLRTGRLEEHRPADLITRLAPVEYDPTAECPRFMRFLKEALVDDAVISFIKRYTGYTLTGITRERLFAILYGSGKNGKTTLVELLQDVMGDYATNTDTETILAKKYQGVGNDVAALKGARFVSAAEVEQGRRLAESKVKQLTGSDTVTARFLFGEPFDFRPNFKLWLSTNNKPVVQGTDDAIWDRIRLVPFTKRFEGKNQDPQLPETLRGELAGILAWMVAGCLEWQEHGIEAPTRITAATAQYRREMDTLAAFLEERCVVHPAAVALATPLYAEYKQWCEEAGERQETQTGFGRRLGERGFKSDRETSGANKGKAIWRGIGLRSGENPPPGGGNPSPGEGSGGNPSPDESPVSTPDSAGTEEAVKSSEGKNQQVSSEKLRVGEVLEKPFTPFTTLHSTTNKRPLTEEEARQVQRLISQGMEARAARAAVLGEELEL